MSFSGQKRTPVYRIVYKPNGTVLVETAGLGPKRVRLCHAYDCLNAGCSWEFRVKWPPPKVVESHGVGFGCPRCGSLYVEWLSYDSRPENVVLDTDEEWGAWNEGR